MADYAAILERAKQGKLTHDDLNLVLSAFRSDIRKHPDRYRLVMTLGYAALRRTESANGPATLSPNQVRTLIEPLLDATADPWLIREALTVICQYLGDESRHRDRLRVLSHPVDWDEDGDVRVVAISCLGRLVSQEGSGEGLVDLLQVAEDANDPQQDWAIRALAQALGARPLELPSIRDGMRSDPALVRRTLEKAREWRDRAKEKGKPESTA